MSFFRRKLQPKKEKIPVDAVSYHILDDGRLMVDLKGRDRLCTDENDAPVSLSDVNERVAQLMSDHQYALQGALSDTVYLPVQDLSQSDAVQGEVALLADAFSSQQDAVNFLNRTFDDPFQHRARIQACSKAELMTNPWYQYNRNVLCGRAMNHILPDSPYYSEIPTVQQGLIGRFLTDKLTDAPLYQEHCDILEMQQRMQADAPAGFRQVDVPHVPVKKDVSSLDRSVTNLTHNTDRNRDFDMLH